MRSLPVPVRLATLAAALAATAGCVSVGDEAAPRGGPSQPSGSRSGGSAVETDGVPEAVSDADGHRTGGSRNAKTQHSGKPADPDAKTPSASAPGTAAPGAPKATTPAGTTRAPRPVEPGAPTPKPPEPAPTPTRTTPEPEPPKPTPEPPAPPEPTVAEPSSSAHEEPPPQGQAAARTFRVEPSPEAGQPVV
ncbi:hypothetical protein ACFVW2_07700 [Streptomyces sp. NPDC058171]